MFLKKEHLWLPALLLMMLLVSCGTNSFAPLGNTGNAAGAEPNRLQIQIGVLSSLNNEPVVTLTDVPLIQKLYRTTFALSPEPERHACTADLGTSYTLSFFQTERKLTTAEAQRYGCHTVSITGETEPRLATQDFWKQLDQAIYQGTPPAQPDLLSILPFSEPGQSPSSARVLSLETVRRLYNAVLELPLVAQYESCADTGRYDYQLVFHTSDQVIASYVDKQCNTITLQGNYKSRGGTYQMDEQFKKLLDRTIKEAKFAPASPDQLSLQLSLGNQASSRSMITDASLRAQLYTEVFKLSRWKEVPDCPSSEDKISGKANWYGFTFTQWDLTILSVTAYEGTRCSYISVENGDISLQLQGTQKYWDLVHHAAKR